MSDEREARVKGARDCAHRFCRHQALNAATRSQSITTNLRRRRVRLAAPSELGSFVRWRPRKIGAVPAGRATTLFAYTGGVGEVRKVLPSRGTSRTQRAGVALGTVHRFQGGERSSVLLSTVVTHPASLSLLNTCPNLLNVATSRAQHHFICLGHAAVLAQGARTRLLTAAAHALAPVAYGRGTQATLFASRRL